MRIGNGPRLAIVRPGDRGYRGWYGRRLTRGQAYDEWRKQERERLRRVPHKTAGDVKPQAVYLNNLRPGEHYRLVDGHGRTYGERLVTPEKPWRFRPMPLVRRVNRQPEDYHSHISRILKAAHRCMLREP